MYLNNYGGDIRFLHGIIKKQEKSVGKNPPTDIENWKQDEDVLDTWFSSALWPFQQWVGQIRE